MVNAFFSSAPYFSMQILSYVYFLIAKYLYIISYSYNTPVVLVCLVNFPLKDVWTHPLPKRHSQESASLQRCVEGYDKWWCCIKLCIATLCFASNFEKKILELHTFVIYCIFSY